MYVDSGKPDDGYDDTFALAQKYRDGGYRDGIDLLYIAEPGACTTKTRGPVVRRRHYAFCVRAGSLPGAEGQRSAQNKDARRANLRASCLSGREDLNLRLLVPNQVRYQAALRPESFTDA